MSIYPNFFTEPHLLSAMAPDSPILLGLSGGADSSALLYLLTLYRERSGAKIIAAHLNHGIRGDKYGNEADRDENFCRELCSRLGAELIIKRLDIPSMAENSGKSLETEARDARYAFFSEIMNLRGIKILATAHNADDNLETQLYNLARGCGIDGMVGIPARRDLGGTDGGVVIRPILKAEKREIMDFCENHSLPYVTDSTNLETECTRNRLRHSVIPALDGIFPKVRGSAMRLSSLASEDSDFILSEAKKFLAASHGRLEAKALGALHPSLARRVIRLAFAEISSATLEYVHISGILNLIASERNGASVSLPDRKRAEFIDGRLYFSEDGKCGGGAVSYSVCLEYGFNRLDGTCFAVLLCSEKPEKGIDGYSFYADAEIKNTNAPLYAESRRPGGTILDGGMNKKIKKLMCDKKVPLADRASLPLIVSGGGVIYAPLCAVSDTVRAVKNDEKLYIAIYKTELGGSR